MRIFKHLYRLFLYHCLGLCPKCHSRLVHYKSKFGLTIYTFCPECDKQAIQNLFETVQLDLSYESK